MYDKELQKFKKKKSEENIALHHSKLTKGLIQFNMKIVKSFKILKQMRQKYQRVNSSTNFTYHVRQKPHQFNIHSLFLVCQSFQHTYTHHLITAQYKVNT